MGGDTVGEPMKGERFDREYAANLGRVQTIGRDKGCVLNPDEERVKKVVGLMTRNYLEFGKYYCPCKQSHPLDPEQDVLCPCPTLEDEVAKEGHCYCRLFYVAEA
jgi:ferredoxin-thioredoxin reductase catalytic chain